MAIRSESRLTIASSVPEVWAYICDVGRWPEWAPTVRECWVTRRGSASARLADGAAGEGDIRVQSPPEQNVTVVDAPRRLAFAGPMGTSAARWGMEFEPIDERETDAMMWVEVDLESIMRAIPGSVLNGRIRRVMDRRDGGDQGRGRVRDAGRLEFVDATVGFSGRNEPAVIGSDRDAPEFEETP